MPPAVLKKMNSCQKVYFKFRLFICQGIAEYSVTSKKAADHIKTAKDALAVFTPSKTKDTLLDIADYALARRV